MNRTDFINEIFEFFSSKDSLKKSYELALTTKDPIDWDKLYQMVITEAETRYLPAPKWFISKFPFCIKHENRTNPNDGKKVAVRLKDGYVYEFVLWGCNKSEGEIREGLYKRFQRGTQNPIKRIEFLGANEYVKLEGA